MPSRSETLPALEQRLAERRLVFDRLDESVSPRVAVWKGRLPTARR